MSDQEDMISDQVDPYITGKEGAVSRFHDRFVYEIATARNNIKRSFRELTFVYHLP